MCSLRLFNPDLVDEEHELPLDLILISPHALTILDNKFFFSGREHGEVREISYIRYTALNYLSSVDTTPWTVTVGFPGLRNQVKRDLPVQIPYNTRFFEQLQFQITVVLLPAVERLTIHNDLLIMVFVIPSPCHRQPHWSPSKDCC